MSTATCGMGASTCCFKVDTGARQKTARSSTLSSQQETLQTLAKCEFGSFQRSLGHPDEEKTARSSSFIATRDFNDLCCAVRHKDIKTMLIGLLLHSITDFLGVLPKKRKENCTVMEFRIWPSPKKRQYDGVHVLFQNRLSKNPVDQLLHSFNDLLVILTKERTALGQRRATGSHAT